MVHRLKKFASDTGEYMMRPIRNFKNTRHYAYLQNIGLGFWIFLIVTFCLGFLFAFYIEEFAAVVVSGYGLIGIFFLTVLLEMIVQPVGPDLAMMLGIFSGISGWMVLMTVLLGVYLALYLSYHVGKKIGTPGIERIIGKRTFGKINWTSGGKWFMLLGATTPIPYIPYLVGLWDFKFRDTLLYVAIPRTIRLIVVMALAYYFGVGLLNLNIVS